MGTEPCTLVTGACRSYFSLGPSLWWICELHDTQRHGVPTRHPKFCVVFDIPDAVFGWEEGVSAVVPSLDKVDKSPSLIGLAFFLSFGTFHEFFKLVRAKHLAESCCGQRGATCIKLYCGCLFLVV